MNRRVASRPFGCEMTPRSILWVAKVVAAWEETHAKNPPPERICFPAACEPFMAKDGERPFSLKHAQQQASIVGNILEEGLADRLPSAALLEVP